MRDTRQFIAGIVFTLAAVALLAWGGWSWFGGRDSGSKIRVEQMPIAGNTAPKVVSAPLVADLNADGLAPSNDKASFVGTAPPEPKLAPNELACPEMVSVTIVQRDLDKQYKGVAPRERYSFGLIKFDLSRLKSVPETAILKTCVFYVENNGGYRTPIRFVFYVMRTDWDDTATWRFAKARDQLSWPTGFFDPNSVTNTELVPVARATVPNPPPPGFNLEVDITDVVAAWNRGEMPNYGLLVGTEPGPGFSPQGNFKNRREHRTYTPQIVCTVPFPATLPIAAPPVQRDRAWLSWLVPHGPTTRPTAAVVERRSDLN